VYQAWFGPVADRHCFPPVLHAPGIGHLQAGSIDVDPSEDEATAVWTGTFLLALAFIVVTCRPKFGLLVGNCLSNLLDIRLFTLVKLVRTANCACKLYEVLGVPDDAAEDGVGLIVDFEKFGRLQLEIFVH